MRQRWRRGARLAEEPAEELTEEELFFQGHIPGKRSATGIDGGPLGEPAASPGKRCNTAGLKAEARRRAGSQGEGRRVEVPYRAEMEQAFGERFGELRVFTGRPDRIDRPGARAAARPGEVAFADRAPAREVVAHELAHILQFRRAGAGSVGSAAGDRRPGEREAHRAGQRAAQGQPAQVRQPAQAPVYFWDDGERDSEGGASARERADAIYEAFHGSLFSEEEEDALDQIRGRSTSELRHIRSLYRLFHDAKLEDEFREYCSDSQAREALSILWPALSVIDRLEAHLDFWGDNEEGMIDVIRSASDDELREARDHRRMSSLLDQLDDDQGFEARRRLWPEPDRLLGHVVWRIKAADDTFNDDEDKVYSAVLELSPAQRVTLYNQHADEFDFLSDSEKNDLRRMCVGEGGGAVTEAEALKVRMEIATSGAGTDDDAVSLVTQRVAALREEEQEIAGILDRGQRTNGTPLSAEERAELQARLDEIGGIEENLLQLNRNSEGEPEEGSFLGMLHDDVGAGEFQSLSTTMGVDPYEVAKQRILDALSWINDDEDAINRVFRDLQAPIELPEGQDASQLSPAALQRLRAEANGELRARLRNDPDLDHVWEHLSEDEMAVVDDYASGDSYRIAVRELEDAYYGFDTEEARIFVILMGMSAEDRARFRSEMPRIYTALVVGSGLNRDEVRLMYQVLETGRLPTDRAIDVALGGWGDGTDEELLSQVLLGLPDQERERYRLGYWLDKQDQPEEELDDGEKNSLDAYRRLRARLESELDDEELDQALDELIGLPTPEEMRSGEGRMRAADIMAARQEEKLELSGGIIDPFTSTDETASQAAAIYQALYRRAQEQGELSTEELAVLIGLDQQFQGRFRDYEATVDLVANIAGTVAATVVAIIIVVISKGTLAPAAAKFIAANGGAALWAAVAGAAAKVGTSEAIGGDFYQATSSEGARDAVIGAIEGATAVAAARLAASATELIGLGQTSLRAGITDAALGAAEGGLSQVGRGAAAGGLEAAIDGFLSGAVGELVMTATDVQTWRQSVWNVLGSLGMSLLRGGAIGAAAGAGTGGLFGAWGARAEARVMEELLSSRITSASDLAGARNVVVGDVLDDAAEAHDILRRLASGDRDALTRLGVGTIPDDFNPSSVEWGIGRLPDGKHVVIRGEPGAVDWGQLEGVVAVAHSHPANARNRLVNAAGQDGGAPIDDIIAGGGQMGRNRVHLLPSAADLGYCARNGLDEHTVHTPFRHLGRGMIGNADAAADGPTVDFVIRGAAQEGLWEGTEIPIYRAEIVARAGDEELWRGPIWAMDHPAMGSVLSDEPPPGLVSLGRGAGAGSSTRTPTGGEERMALLAELEESGVRHTPENIVDIRRGPDGGVVFLETGNSRAGLTHITERHAADFANRGISEDQIPDLVMKAVTEGEVVGHQGRDTGRPIYKVLFGGEEHHVAVTTGSNGFIVGANPASAP